MSLVFRWQQVLGAFSYSRRDSSAWRIYHARAPVDLRAALGPSVAIHVWRDAVEPAFEFYSSIDDVSPRLRLGLLPIPPTGWLACVKWRGTAPFAIAAGATRDPQAVRTFFSELITSNGSVCRLQVFAEPPARACNHQPDLVPCDLVVRSTQALAVVRWEHRQLPTAAGALMVCRSAPARSWCAAGAFAHWSRRTEPSRR